MKNEKKKLVVLMGPTMCGKTFFQQQGEKYGLISAVKSSTRKNREEDTSINARIREGSNNWFPSLNSFTKKYKYIYNGEVYYVNEDLLENISEQGATPALILGTIVGPDSERTIELNEAMQNDYNKRIADVSARDRFVKGQEGNYLPFTKFLNVKEIIEELKKEYGVSTICIMPKSLEQAVATAKAERADFETRIHKLTKEYGVYENLIAEGFFDHVVENDFGKTPEGKISFESVAKFKNVLKQIGIYKEEPVKQEDALRVGDEIIISPDCVYGYSVEVIHPQNVNKSTDIDIFEDKKRLYEKYLEINPNYETDTIDNRQDTREQARAQMPLQKVTITSVLNYIASRYVPFKTEPKTEQELEPAFAFANHVLHKAQGALSLSLKLTQNGLEPAFIVKQYSRGPKWHEPAVSGDSSEKLETNSSLLSRMESAGQYSNWGRSRMVNELEQQPCINLNHPESIAAGIEQASKSLVACQPMLSELGFLRGGDYALSSSAILSAVSKHGTENLKQTLAKSSEFFHTRRK